MTPAMAGCFLWLKPLSQRSSTWGFPQVIGKTGVSRNLGHGSQTEGPNCLKGDWLTTPLLYHKRTFKWEIVTQIDSRIEIGISKFGIKSLDIWYYGCVFKIDIIQIRSNEIKLVKLGQPLQHRSQSGWLDSCQDPVATIWQLRCTRLGAAGFDDISWHQAHLASHEPGAGHWVPERTQVWKCENSNHPRHDFLRSKMCSHDPFVWASDSFQVLTNYWNTTVESMSHSWSRTWQSPRPGFGNVWLL